MRFNPRTRESATDEVIILDELAKVSIHALVRVRHINYSDMGAAGQVSIHALVRVRQGRLDWFGVFVKFQSTHS